VSYERLAGQLEEIARRLRSRPEALAGLPLARAAEKVQAALAPFVKAVDAALRGADPDVVALRDWLESAEARVVIDAAGVKAVSKGALGKAVTVKKTDTAEDLRRRLLESAVKAGRAGEVLTAARAFVSVRARPAADPSDRQAVLNELWRLGGMSGDGLEVEKLRLLECRELLFAMASYAHIRTTAKSTPKAVLTKVLQFARRVEENTS
jgi:hypothetical protein